VIVKYTIQNLTGTTPLSIDRTYQYKAKTGWKPLGHAVTETFDTAGGPRSYTFSFVAPAGYPMIRVAIGMTIAGQTQQKSVVLRIKS
jgi:hypothetical protein